MTHILFNHNCDVNILDMEGQNALFYAVLSLSENVDIFTHLIDNMCHYDLINHQQETLLIKSIEKEYYLFAEILVNHSVKNINHTKKNGDTPLHIAV